MLILIATWIDTYFAVATKSFNSAHTYTHGHTYTHTHIYLHTHIYTQMYTCGGNHTIVKTKLNCETFFKTY